MRAVLGIVALLVVLAVVGLLAKKQLGAVATPPDASRRAGAPGPAATPQQRVEQFKQGAEAVIQQPRPMPDDSK